MENNNQNPNTGAKGVFPGINHQVGSTAGELPLSSNREEVIVTHPGQPIFSEQNGLNSANTKTYFRMETKNAEGQVSGILEIDLISFREKGEESRYVKFFSVGAAEDGTQSETTISIDNEGDFNRFKKFVSDLNWND